MTTIGIIGLGNMGYPMALNIIAKGFETIVYDTVAERSASLATRGARVATSIASIIEFSEIVLFSLPNVAAVRSVLHGAEGVLAAGARGKIVVDTSTGTPTFAREAAEAVARAGGAYLDAPVTGGVAGAEKGTLNLMIGGDVAAYDRALPLLRAIGGRIVHIGASGHGQTAKLVNQMLMGVSYAAVAECYAFAAQQRVDIARVFDAIEDGGAQSLVHSLMKPYLLSGELEAGGGLAQHGKDLDYAMEEAIRHHSYVPVTAAAHAVWSLARLQLSGVNSVAMFGLWEELLGTKLHAAAGGDER